MKRVLAAAVVALMALTACGGGDGNGGGATASPDAAPSPTLSPLVEDGTFTGQGVILPVPDDWIVNRANLQAGLVIVVPQQGAQQNQVIVAADDIETNQQVQIQADSMEGILEQLRAQVDHEPVIDEPIDFQGAEQAHQLVYEDVPANQQGTAGTPGPPSQQLSIIARSSDGQFALFNYVAPQDSYEESIADQLRNEGGLDPDSEPSRVQVPTQAPTAPAQPTATPTG